MIKRLSLLIIISFSLTILAAEEDNKVYAKCEVTEHSISKKDIFFISDKGEIESLIINKNTKRFYISDESGSQGFEYKYYSDIRESYKNTFEDEYSYYIEKEELINEEDSIKFIINFNGITGILDFNVYYIKNNKDKSYSESKRYLCNKVKPM